jgi:DNA modification methylase
MAVTTQNIHEKFAIYNGDCCEVAPTLPDASVGFSVYSPPFAELYNYSSNDRDMSNCATYQEFLDHYAFIVAQIFRITKPGRLTVVHCMDLKISGGQRDFPGDIIRLHERLGWHYQTRITIWKEPLAYALRTRQLGLQHKQIVKDSSRCHAAGSDYILAFRKGGVNKEPISNPHGITTYAGANSPPSELIKKYANWENPRTNKLAHWIWQRYASSVWMDIRPGRLLPYREAKENEEEKHVCPLQLDVIDRCLQLWSKEGDVTFTPFMGVGSEVYRAFKMGRRPIGIELKPSYYRQALRNLQEGLENRVSEAEQEPGDFVDHAMSYENEGEADEPEEAEGQDQDPPEADDE